MSRRTERVASLIRALLAEAIQNRLSDPRIEQLTSITRVELSPDFSVAHVHVSVLAEKSRRELCVKALKHATGKLRSILARELTLRQTPEIVFKLDESIQHGFRTVQQIDQIMAELDGPREQDATVEQDASEQQRSATRSECRTSSADQIRQDQEDC